MRRAKRAFFFLDLIAKMPKNASTIARAARADRAHNHRFSPVSGDASRLSTEC
jgi:hypothetical protein